MKSLFAIYYVVLERHNNNHGLFLLTVLTRFDSLVHLHEMKINIYYYRNYYYDVHDLLFIGYVFQVIPCLKRRSVSLSNCSLIRGLCLVIWRCSRILLRRLFLGAAQMMVQVKEWLGFLSRCLAGSDLLEGWLCSVHRMSAILSVWPMYNSLQEHFPL